LTRLRVQYAEKTTVTSGSTSSLLFLTPFVQTPRASLPLPLANPLGPQIR